MPHTLRNRATLLCVCFFLACAFALGLRSAHPAEARLQAVADANISSHASEINRNYGRSSRIRIKGIEMMLLVRFDTAPIQGWTVDKAALFVHAAGPHMLKTLGVSTVAVDWVEGEGRAAEEKSGATFMWADVGRRAWGGPQSDFTDAAFTARNTRVHYADVQERDGGWLEIGLPPSFVHDLADGVSFGLAVADEKGQTRANNDVHSREQSGFAPYLLVTGTPTGRVASAPKVVPPPPPAPPLPAALKAPDVVTWPGGEPPLRDDRLRVWAYGDCEKAHPVSGNLLEEVGPEQYAKDLSGDYRKRNVVWDGAASTVHLSAARNEFVAFHLCVEAATGPLLNVRVAPPVFDRIPPANVAVFKNWCVKDGDWFPEVAVPLEGSFSIPDSRNRIEGQRNQSLFVEILVPADIPAGEHAGRLRIEADGVKSFELPIRLVVWNFALPDNLSFDVDLNAYGPPGDADMELKFHRMAHAHRATLNILGYNQSGRANPAYAPPLEGQGKDIRVADWSEFDRRHGRYFDGSAFADLPRKGVPLTHAYLPFHEGWPCDIRKHYRYTPAAAAYPDVIAEHALKALPIEEAFDDDFKDAFVSVVRQFAAHFREKGWTRTEFHFYLNNKYYFKDPRQGGRGSSWWLLDEPMHRDDWLALRFFARMFKNALSTQPSAPQSPNAQTLSARALPAESRTPNPLFIFRADISRPQWQRDWLDGLVDLMCVSKAFFQKNARCLDFKRAQGARFWHYGTGNDIRATNLTAEAWGLKAYLAGADGFLPWNSLGGDASFDKPTPTAILYPGARFGLDGPLASLRLKAFRRSQQDVEYLVLLAQKMKWNREQTAAAVAPLLDLAARTHEAFTDDAGRTVFDRLSSDQFARLRAALSVCLSH